MFNFTLAFNFSGALCAFHFIYVQSMRHFLYVYGNISMGFGLDTMQTLFYTKACEDINTSNKSEA